VHVDVRHDEQNHRFVAEVEGKESALTYRRLNASTLDLQSTFVPVELRERGVGKELVRYALDWARGHEHEVVASCPFVQAYVAEHPEVANVISTARI
jgi:predicted GNAT family acetyltransferase